MNGTAAAGTGRLLWRCRRGMKELDLLLEGWIEERWCSASVAEREVFARFLELPDPQIAGLLLGDEAPADPAFAPLVRQLRRESADRLGP